MGCVSSTMSTMVAPRTVSNNANVTRSAFYAGHPGIRAVTAKPLESEIASVVRAQDPNDESTIKVKNIDLNLEENSQSHHTDEYDVIQSRKLLVIRRGQSFDLDIEFNREYNRATDELRIVFNFGDNPRTSKRTHAEFVLSDKDFIGEWGATIKSKGDNSIKISVVSPPNCFVGKWKLVVHVVKRDDTGVSIQKYEQPGDVYILFNPWCKDDTVFMHETDKLNEYVLKESGRIYRGSSRRITYKEWNFGQFEENILDCVLYLLDDRSGIPEMSRGDPVVTVRRISALVNAPDDGGVLVGNWSGDYEGGTPPLDWNGSVAILDEYYAKKRPVKFGQCWVFSGITTTMCRALGIPSRSVTNFVSAHDTDGSITIDAHFGEDKKPLKMYDSDSVWNFHVWNDVWMARPDLPPGYGGWQAIDATPQETSQGIFCLGPTSLHAVRNGDLYLPYDGQFVFAEVNADRLLWMVMSDHTVNLVRKQKKGIGRFVSTSGLNGKDREDVSRDYKYKEGTEEERAAVLKANLFSTRKGLYECGPEDVDFEVSSDPDTFMGDTVKLQFKMHNKGSEARTVDGRLVVSTMYYTGVHYQDIYDEEFQTTILQANGDHAHTVEILESKYLNCLMDHCMLKISRVCLVKETKQAFCDVEELRLRKPHLEVKAPDRGRVRQKVNVEVTFTNPLSVPLTRCELRIEGPGLVRPLLQKYGNVEPKKQFSANFDLTPYKPGKREIMISFNSTQMRSVNGSHEIAIERIGRFVSTSGLNGKDREDVSRDYKYKEGTEEERAAVLKANLFSTRKGLYECGPEDVDFEVSSDPDTFMGDTVKLQFKMHNKGSEARTVDGRLVVSTMYYTGVHYQDIYDEEFQTTILQANGDHAHTVEILESKYLNCLMDHCMLKISRVCLVKETKQAFCDVEELRLRKPHLEVKAPDRGRVRQKVNVEVTFTNPLSVPLTRCELRIEGPGLVRPLLQKYGNVEPKKQFSANFDLTPYKPGKREIMISFNSTQMRSVNGSHEIAIER